LETNALEISKITTIHTMTIYDTEVQEYQRYDLSAVPQGLKRLSEADMIAGHNIINFDIPAIRHLYPTFTCKEVRDTLVLSRVIYPDIKEFDFKLVQRGLLPIKLIGSHSLKAWGYRLGEYKGSFSEDGDFSTWTPQMSDYCEQDVHVTVKLWEKLVEKKLSQEAEILEHEVATIIQRQVAFGFPFKQKDGEALYVTLSKRKQELTEELQKVFPPWQVRLADFVPKRDNKTKGYKAGVPVARYDTITFNPGSRQHIIYQLQTRYKWKPTEFTEKGTPKVDDEVLNKLPYPEAKVLAEYFMVDKRLGQLGDGDKAWLKLVKDDGRIHGDVITNGAVTGRMTHSNPNVAQVPAVRVPYGVECRSLFHVPAGYKEVGCDASGLELRCLAHYMARYDGGAYAKVILEGDIHSVNQQAAGLPTRDNAKTFI
jgi:DNA polymerase I-like protein with 3'-5' exonuclease and polymerase domains